MSASAAIFFASLPVSRKTFGQQNKTNQMKRLFTILAAVLLAASVQAQTTYSTNTVFTEVTQPVVTTTIVGSGSQAVTTYATNLVATWSSNQVVTTTTIQQTPGTATPPTNAVLAGVSLPDSLSIVYNAIQSSGILQATNYAIDVYGTYANKAPTKLGGGVLLVYNIPALTSTTGTNGGNMGVGLALGLDWLGSWSLVSANVTLKADTHPLANISWLPDSIRTITGTPIAIFGTGQAMSGSSGAATLYDLGYSVRFGHLWGGQFNVGVTWGEWMNAGAYSGHRWHGFLGWQHGIPHS
jgi:hypothetical protein